MQFIVASLLAVAAVVSAEGAAYQSPAYDSPGYQSVYYSTATLDNYVTYCAEPTVFTYGGYGYTVTEATTLTIEGPCTVTYPVYPTYTVECQTCNQPEAPCTTGQAPPPVYTTPAVYEPSTLPTAGAGKVAALSGAVLAGIVGVAALL